MSQESLPDRPARWLRVDADGVVTGISAPWAELVRTAFVGCLAPASVGRRFAPLGSAATAIWEHLLDETRRGRPVTAELWAATPEAAAKFELTVQRSDGDDEELALELLFERARPQPQPFFDPQAPRGDDAIRACGFCQRLDSFRWTEPELALVQLRVDPVGTQPRLKPDVCVECELRLRGSLVQRLAS